MLQRDDAIVREGQRITIDNWRSVFQSAKEVLVTSFWVLDIQGCVPDVFLGAPQSRRSISSELMARFEAEGETFLSRILTADETWVHYFESETKRQSKEWHRLPLPEKKNMLPVTKHVVLHVYVLRPHIYMV
jgi:hypothetical protein